MAPKTLVQATEALHAAVKTIEKDLQSSDAQELAAWSLQSIRIMRAGVQKTLEMLTDEDELFADDTLEGYSDNELRDMLVDVRHSSAQLATLRAVSLLYEPEVAKPDGCALHPSLTRAQWPHVQAAAL